MKFLSLLALLAFATVAGRAGPPPTPGCFRVLSYNIHHGEGMDQKIDLARIAQLIRETKADLVALQEVDRGVERTARRDLPAELARLTGLTVYFERNLIHQGGDYGNAVLTRFPIKHAQNTLLKKIGAGEQRGVLQLVLDLGGRDLLFMNTHLDSRKDEAERVVSAGELARLVDAAGDTPVMICGDFNTVPGSASYQAMAKSLDDAWPRVGQGDGFTIPVPAPNKRIDYVWISPEAIEPIRLEVLRSLASDHEPLLGEFRLRAPKGK